MIHNTNELKNAAILSIEERKEKCFFCNKGTSVRSRKESDYSWLFYCVECENPKSQLIDIEQISKEWKYGGYLMLFVEQGTPRRRDLRYYLTWSIVIVDRDTMQVSICHPSFDSLFRIVLGIEYHERNIGVKIGETAYKKWQKSWEDLCTKLCVDSLENIEQLVLSNIYHFDLGKVVKRDLYENMKK